MDQDCNNKISNISIMEPESSTLLLNTFDISPSTNQATYYNKIVDNQYGTISNNRCTLTWKNINMKKILSEMYDKYETFNLKLYQITQSTTLFTGSAITVTGSLVDVRISGLPFLNNGYNIVSRNNTNELYLTSIAPTLANYTNAGIVITSNPVCLTFGKCTEVVNITIDIKNTKDQTYPVIAANTAIGQFLFHFKIFGIPKEKI